jgi:hypothetical protein
VKYTKNNLKRVTSLRKLKAADAETASVLKVVTIVVNAVMAGQSARTTSAGVADTTHNSLITMSKENEYGHQISKNSDQTA